MSEQEKRIEALANILSLVAIVGGMDKAAVQRVLLSLGSTLLESPSTVRIEPNLAAKLLSEIARESGEAEALRIAAEMSFVAQTWRPVLDTFPVNELHISTPYAEIIYALVNHSAYALHDYDAFRRFGGRDLVLPMPQLTAALKTYPIPKTGLVWELVGFLDPPDQALVGGDTGTMYLFKAAVSNVSLRFSELARGREDDANPEHDILVDDSLFAAFVAGLLGDMLYWSARLRADALTGRQTWKRIQTLLSDAPSTPPPGSALKP